MRRCVGMADEGDSKSLVLITRVGSTPTTGIKKLPQLVWGSFLFYLRRVSGSNSTALHRQVTDLLHHFRVELLLCLTQKGFRPLFVSF